MTCMSIHRRLQLQGLTCVLEENQLYRETEMFRITLHIVVAS